MTAPITHLDDYRPGPQPAARPLPANVEAEQAVLGAILSNNAVLPVIGAFLEPKHFSEALHQRIFEVSVALIKGGQAATPITLKTFLGEGDIGGMTLPQYLARLCAEAVAPINAPAYARLITDLAARREVIAAAQEAIERAYDPPVDLPVGKLIDGILEKIRAVGDWLPQEDEDESIGGAVGRLLETSQDTIAGKAAWIPSTGLEDLDKTIGGGLRRRRLIVFAGRPGVGKTVLLTAIARRAAQKGAGIGVFSLEIDVDEFTSRLTANVLASGLDPMDYRDMLIGKLTGMQIDRITNLKAWISNLPIEFCGRGGLTLQQIETRAVKMKKKFISKGLYLDSIMIDYLGLVAVSDRYKGNLVNEYGEIALGAKNMAKRLDTNVSLFSQLSRAVEGRDNKRPMIADLRGSGNIEEHADAVCLLYRPSYYDQNNPDVIANDPDALAAAEARAHDLEGIWGKNRLGPTTTNIFYCDVAKSQVDNMERHQ